MDFVFQCPHCEQELEVDSEAAGTEIACPTCNQKIVIPEPEAVAGAEAGVTDQQVAQPPPPSPAAPPGPARTQAEVHPINPIAVSAAAKEEKHFQVPVRDKPAESLIGKPLKPLEFAAKESEKKIRVKTVRRIDCMEVGHDRFDEVVTNFLDKIGEDHIISINTLSYTYLDIGSQKLLTDYGVLIVYRG